MANPGSPQTTHRRRTWRRLRTWRGAAVAASIVVASVAATTLAWNGTSHETTATHHTTTSPSSDPLTGSALHGVADHTGAAQADADHALKSWNASSSGTAPGRAGAILAVLRIPALGANWSEPIYEGVGDQQLAAGIGHFPGTESPGQKGNYALAGHRSGVAQPPLRNIDNIKTGSIIKVITESRITFTYKVTSVKTVLPTDVNVIAQVPGHPQATPTHADLTLITCWPAYGHSRRVVVVAQLTSAPQGGV